MVFFIAGRCPLMMRKNPPRYKFFRLAVVSRSENHAESMSLLSSNQLRNGAKLSGCEK
jgi:hypothetical protein